MMIQQEINFGWTFRQVGTEEWLPATVPGCIHTDLLTNRKIEDPFYRLNEHKLQWIDKEDWEYLAEFQVEESLLDHDRIALDFKGLDTYAEVYINEEKVLSTDNMFREYLLDVKAYLKSGNNRLRIIFLSPITVGIKKYDANDFVIPVSFTDFSEIGKVEGGKRVSVYTRKPGYHFGWDWGPRLVTSGIWRPVFLKAWNEFRIESLQVLQNKIDSRKARCTAVLNVESNIQGPAMVIISIDEQKLAQSEIRLSKEISIHTVEFEIENPELWWTNGLGNQPLYKIDVKLSTETSSAETSDRIGLRTLELIREKDEKGTSFYFQLNGVPVFMKGANYIPNDVFLPRVTEENYRRVIETARISNNNMLRIWGGGIYENDIFYDLCDEAGILVWQDFMFACAMFPGDEAFLENVKQEAIVNVKRLRNHPCIALWCGNNEILSAWKDWGWEKEEITKNKENADKLWQAYVDIFHKVLPDVVNEFDPQRSYWGSSPSSGLGIPADLKNGDEHYWGVWWKKEPFSNYATHIARFMSEYGFQSFPELKTIKQYALPEDYSIDSEVMNSHQRSYIGNSTIEYYMLQDYQKPKDFASFLYVNHVLQAEGIKFALEGHRRAMPYCMGSLYWQINDCWPVASWSSTDYYQRWKALQYFVKKGFEPVLVSPYIEENELKVGIVNDTLREIKGTLRVQMLDFFGKSILNQTYPLTIPENSSACYFIVNKEDFLKDKDSKNQFLSVELIENEEVIASNQFYFEPVKRLNLPVTDIDFNIKKTGKGFNITIDTKMLAKNLYMTIGDEDGFFSDNYFDLLPAKQKTVSLETLIPMEKLKQVFSVRSLIDAF